MARVMQHTQLPRWQVLLLVALALAAVLAAPRICHLTCGQAHSAGGSSGSGSSEAGGSASSAPPACGSGQPRHRPFAFVTLLASHGQDSSQQGLEADGYFQSVRLLNYRLTRNPATRTRLPGAQFVVLVAPQVLELKRDILRREGALVLEVDVGALTPRGVRPPPGYERWADGFAKLMPWKLTQYSGVAVLDGDMMVLRNIDDVFGFLTSTDFAAVPNLGFNHEVSDWFNSGFMLLRPSSEVFRRMLWLLARPDLRSLYDQGAMDQNFLNWYFTPNYTRLPLEYNGQWFWDLRLQDTFRVAHCKFWSEFQGQRGYADVQALFFDAVRNELPGLGRYLQG